MAGPKLQQVQRLSLQQVLAPQLQQSLHLLQVPTLELRTLVREELQQNPLLEELPEETVSLEADGTPSAETKEDAKTKEELDFEKEFEVLARLDDEWREYFSQTSVHRGRNEEEEERRQFLFDSIVQQESLQQHLLNQLGLAAVSDEQRRVMEFIIGNINDDGYLTSPLEELAANSGLPLEQLQQALDLVQTFHPVGVGARDLKECLLIQLDRLGKSDSLDAHIVERHLEDLGRKRYPEIAKALGVSVEDVQQAANFIATLEPKPGRMFSSEPNHYIAPDVVVQRVNGDFVVMLNDEQIPRLRISNTYRELIQQQDSGAEIRDYVREKIRAGKFLIKSIHQRQQTIYNIAREIVRLQHDFFVHGITHLKPLTMAKVADLIGVHETTVSRAVANKYMQTPHGIFEMKFFFTPGYETKSGQTLSNKSVKESIATLIAREDPAHPLSDQEIVAKLGEQGIPIARRTVAKYRAELNILPSNLRKKF
jgi:RNA polymerase sigma-54 factor